MCFLDKNFNKYKYLLICLIFIILIIYFCTFFSFSFNTDEEVTMGLIQHNYKSIININSFDVHPPLYYLSLKIFLSIFTFWTKSIFIKIIMARIYSLVLSFIAFYILNKISYISGIHLNSKYKFVLFYLMPSVLAVATHVRMYELGTLFIIAEYYLLIKFLKYNKNYNLYIAVIFSVLSIYTQYYIGILSLVMLCVFFVKDIVIKKDNNNLVSYFISAVTLILLCLPIIPYVIKQFINRNSYPTYNEGVLSQTISASVQLMANSIIKEIFDCVLFLLVLISIIIMLRTLNNISINARVIEILSCIIISLFTEICISVIYRPFFESRCLFPLIDIYYFLFVVILLDFIKIKYNEIKFNKIIILLFSFLGVFLLFININKIVQNVSAYDYSSVKLINDFHKWKSSNNKYVIVDTKGYPYSSNMAWYATQDSVYLKSINKYSVVKDAKDTNIYKECNGNKRLVHKLFNNLIIYKN